MDNRTWPKGEHRIDAEGNPAGGASFGLGFQIEWQDGPASTLEERNGAQVEEVLEACLGRLDFLNGFYTRRGLTNEYNQRAMRGIREAQVALEERTAERRSRDVEGTHNV